MSPITNCPTCDGDGIVYNGKICRTCKGTGKLVINSLIFEKRDMIENNKKVVESNKNRSKI